MFRLFYFWKGSIILNRVIPVENPNYAGKFSDNFPRNGDLAGLKYKFEFGYQANYKLDGSFQVQWF
jgi:hypothetical protein